MKKVCLISLLWMLCFSIYGQLGHPIRNFIPQEYQGQNQIWDITQNQNGELIFANHDNLLIYNGEAWEKYKINQATIFRSVLSLNEVFYSGGLMDFGFWKKNEFGEFEYTSIPEKLSIQMEDGETFWNILNINDNLIFQSFEHIYLVNLQQNSYKRIDGNFNNNSLFKIKNEVIYLDLDKGFFSINLNQIKPIKSPPKINFNEIVGLIEINNQANFVTQTGICYTLDFQGFIRESKIRFPEKNIYSILQLKSKNIAIGTIDNGIRIYNTKNQLLDSFNKNKGLANNTILSIFEDKEENIWLGLDRGISLVNYNSRYLEYFNQIKDIGSVYTAIYFNEKVYLGTNQGLFYFKNDTKKEILPIKEIRGQIWGLSIIDDKLYCSSNSGLDEIKKDHSVRKINEEVGFWEIKENPDNSAILAAGTYEGIYIFEKTDRGLILKLKPTKFQNSSRYFEFKNQSIYVNNEYLGLYELYFQPDFSKLLSFKNLGKKGEKSSLFKLNKEILYKTNKGIYRINNQTIQLDSGLTKQFIPEKHISSSMFKGKGESLLTLEKDGLKFFQKNVLNNSIIKFKNYLPDLVNNNLGNSGFENINYLTEDKYLIGLSDGFILFDQIALNNQMINPIKLTKIQILKENTWIPIDFKSKEIMIPFNNNSIRFSFTNPNYQKYEPIALQYQLEKNGHPILQEISFKGKIDFINLEPGNYQLRISTMNNSFKNEILFIQFSVNPPWYLNQFFITIYLTTFIILFVSLFLFTRLYFKRREKKIALENKKKIENQELIEKEKIDNLMRKNLQSELKNKKRELIITSESIIRKNTLLKQIGEELIQIEKNHAIDLSKLKKFIERNISEKADWQRFETAFNEFDQEFIQKIRIKYGNKLSQQDYLLVTYIRSGLSSKEIANLFNISTKSVEMKRYRLRLKMDIPTEFGLFEFINKI